MYKLISFYNQNRKKILIAVLVIAFIIILIQLANYFSKSGKKTISENNTVKEANSSGTVQMTSNESAVTGDSISTTQKENAQEVVTNFVSYCNNQQITEAYNMLTDECKEEMYPTENDFQISYYNYIFNGNYKKYSMENWIGNTYKVEFSEDIMATGNTNSEKLQDYITLEKKDNEYKLNINSYIGRSNVNKTTEVKNVKITVVSKDTYMNTEKYNIEVENTSGKTVLLDTRESTKTIYLQDSKSAKYYADTTKLLQNQLVINDQYKLKGSIEFYSTYSSSKNIKSIVFSNVILDYDEYKNVENKEEYEKNTFIINV